MENQLILNSDEIGEVILGISKEILKNRKSGDSLAIIGLQTRGVFLAHRISKTIKKISGIDLPEGILDITLYRDDVTKGTSFHAVKKTEINFPIDSKNIVLVDDVLFTGRSIRAAIDVIMDFGRPKKIQLAVLIDRGHRELPIRPDYVGRTLATAINEPVRVMLSEEDGKDMVVIDKEDKQGCLKNK